ncbi:MAG: ABC transporter ATP-binding protein [Litorimonas sp.]
MIELNNIYIRYGKKPVVEDVSVKAAAGQFIALVGPNGSGKSSLLKAIAGLIPYNGRTSLPTQRRDRAKHLSYLAQDSLAPDDRKVEDIIALGRTPFLGSLAKLSKADKAAIIFAAEACETQTFFGRKFGTLSGGEKMRVHLSRALATQAANLLADEPTTALDPYYQISVMNILRKTANTGTTIIVAMHDLKVAERYADQIWVLSAGRLVATGSARTVLSDSILKDVFRITADGKIAESSLQG